MTGVADGRDMVTVGVEVVATAVITCFSVLVTADEKTVFTGLTAASAAGGTLVLRTGFTARKEVVPLVNMSVAEVAGTALTVFAPPVVN